MYSEHDYAECSLPNGKKAVFYYSPFCSIDNRKRYLLEVKDRGRTLMTFDFVMLCNLLDMMNSLKNSSLEEMSPWRVIEDAHGNWRVCCGTEGMRHSIEEHGVKDIKGELTYEELMDLYEALECLDVEDSKPDIEGKWRYPAMIHPDDAEWVWLGTVGRYNSRDIPEELVACDMQQVRLADLLQQGRMGVEPTCDGGGQDGSGSNQRRRNGAAKILMFLIACMAAGIPFILHRAKQGRKEVPNG